MNRKDFKLLEKAVYLDSAGAALKPKQVIDAIVGFYNDTPVNSHSGDTDLGVKVAEVIKETREKVAHLIDASPNEVIFTSGTTDSINRIAQMIKDRLTKDDEILLSYYNHSSNITPWMQIAKETGAKIVYAEDVISGITAKTKLVAYASINNTIYVQNDCKAIYKKAKEVGAIVINDAAHAIVHSKVSLDDYDVIAFSANKLYGPTGVGILSIKEELLSKLFPNTTGGGAVTAVNENGWEVSDTIERFEPGTYNTAGIFGLNAAIDYFNKEVANGGFQKEKDLAKKAHDLLSTNPEIIISSKRGDVNIIFNVKGFQTQDVVSYLGHKGIYLRSGMMCAKAVKFLKDFRVIRASISMYNNMEDIEKLHEAIKNGGDFLEFI